MTKAEQILSESNQPHVTNIDKVNHWISEFANLFATTGRHSAAEKDTRIINSTFDREQSVVIA